LIPLTFADEIRDGQVDVKKHADNKGRIRKSKVPPSQQTTAESARRRKQLQIIDAFGRFDFDPCYDYKFERWKRESPSGRKDSRTKKMGDPPV